MSWCLSRAFFSALLSCSWKKDIKQKEFKVFCKMYFLISRSESELIFQCSVLLLFHPHDFSTIVCQSPNPECQILQGRLCFKAHLPQHCPRNAFPGEAGTLHSRWRPEACRLTSHGPWAAWCLSWICQSSMLGSAQWCMVSTTGRVSSAPGGPQLTTGVSSVWLSSTGGLPWNRGERQKGTLS